ELLVRNGAGVEAVVAALLGLVERRIEQHTVGLLEDRQDRLAAGRSVAPEHGDDLVPQNELFGLFLEEAHLRFGVFNDRFDLLAEDAALGVDLLDREQLSVV